MPNFNEEHLAFRDSIRRLAEKIRPIASEIDETGVIPGEIVSLMGDMGLHNLLVPEKYDGPGGDLTSLCILREELARVSMACAILGGNNSMGLVLPLLESGTEEQRQKFLPPLTAGRTFTSVALTEPAAGSDVASMTTRAYRDGDDYVINGQKCFVTFGDRAHYVLTFARVSGEGSDSVSGISAFIVDTSTPGFRVGKVEHKMGQRGVPVATLYYDDVRVPKENMLGDEGRGFIAAMKCLDMNRPTIAAASVGLAQGAFDAALAYAKEREQFGQPIGKFQAIQFMLADMQMAITASRELVYETARLIDSGDRTRMSEMAAMSKCYASDMAMKVTTDAIQIYGGAGYMCDYPLERYMRDAKGSQIYEGTNQIQRVVIARKLGL